MGGLKDGDSYSGQGGDLAAGVDDNDIIRYLKIIDGLLQTQDSALTNNSGLNDAFGRLRVSNPRTLHDSQLQYNLQPSVWFSDLTGSGTITHLPDESSGRLRVTTASGDKVIRQTKEYFRYKPGKSQLIILTGVLGDTKSNVRRCMGYFDDNNGVFLEDNGTNLGVTVRSNTTGTPVETRVAQADWNLDKMDGTGNSEVTLDMSKAQIFFIDLEWLGVGRVRCGFFVGGKPIYCHEFLHANIKDEVYMTTANLPVRYELENTGTSASQTDMKQICSTVISEGGFITADALNFSATNGTTFINNIQSQQMVIAIRPKLTFNSIENRMKIMPSHVDLRIAVNDAFFEIIQGCTLSGSPTWSDADAESGVEYTVTDNTTVSGGTVKHSGYAPEGRANSVGQLTTIELSDKEPITLNFDGTDSEIYAVVVTSMAGNNVDAAASIEWKEIY